MLSFNTGLLFVTIAFLFHNANSFEVLQKSSVVDILKQPATHFFSEEPIKLLETESRCGEALNYSSSGGIFYEAFGQVVSNERCAWVIGVPGARGYRVSLYSLDPSTNQANSRQNLVITGVRHGGWTGSDPPVLTSYKPENVGTFEVPDSNIIIVTFYSLAQNNPVSRGFVLQYEPMFTGSINSTSLQSRHTIYGSELDILSHPLSRTYFVLELSAFIFPPNNNIYTDRMEHILYEGEHVYGCEDSLYFYRLNVAPTPGNGIWDPFQRICGNIRSTSIPKDDMVLVLFQTDFRSQNGRFLFSNFICQAYTV